MVAAAGFVLLLMCLRFAVGSRAGDPVGLDAELALAMVSMSEAARKALPSCVGVMVAPLLGLVREGLEAECLGGELFIPPPLPSRF